MDRFTIRLCDIRWATNLEYTRSFLVCGIQKPDKNELNEILKVCNETVEAFAQLPLYANPTNVNDSTVSAGKMNGVSKDTKTVVSEQLPPTEDFSDAFHISIAWTLESPTADDIDQLESLARSAEFEAVKETSFTVSTVKVKVGNIIKSIPLRSIHAKGTSLYGT